MEAAEKARIKNALEEALQALERDELHTAVVMYNFIATWAGFPFALWGWFGFVMKLIETDLMVRAATPSRIVTPNTMPSGVGKPH